MPNPTCQFKDCKEEGFCFGIMAWQRHPWFGWLCMMHGEAVFDIFKKLIKDEKEGE